jgi:peptidoglycan hydrolase CwlO-like protein
VADVFGDLLEMKDDMDDIDKKVGATMNTVVSLGNHVIEQGKDISKVRNDVGNLGERVDNVEEDLTDTKVKIEEIDNKVNSTKFNKLIIM